jgi:hypothetical protein
MDLEKFFGRRFPIPPKGFGITLTAFLKFESSISQFQLIIKHKEKGRGQRYGPGSGHPGHATCKAGRASPAGAATAQTPTPQEPSPARFCRLDQPCKGPGLPHPGARFAWTDPKITLSTGSHICRSRAGGRPDTSLGVLAALLKNKARLTYTAVRSVYSASGRKCFPGIRKKVQDLNLKEKLRKDENTEFCAGLSQTMVGKGKFCHRRGG